jgi:hypothetical protein
MKPQGPAVAPHLHPYFTTGGGNPFRLTPMMPYLPITYPPLPAADHAVEATPQTQLSTAASSGPVPAHRLSFTSPMLHEVPDIERLHNMHNEPHSHEAHEIRPLNLFDADMQVNELFAHHTINSLDAILKSSTVWEQKAKDCLQFIGTNMPQDFWAHTKPEFKSPEYIDKCQRFGDDFSQYVNAANDDELRAFVYFQTGVQTYNVALLMNKPMDSEFAVNLYKAAIKQALDGVRQAREAREAGRT